MEKKNPEVESKVKVITIIFAVLLAAVIAGLVIHGKNSGTSGKNTANSSTTSSSTADNSVADNKAAGNSAEDNNAADNSTADGGAEKPNDSQTVEDKVYTPTFMMFVTKNDANYDEYMAVIDEVKAEYEGRVNFDITDIEEESEAKDNFGDIIALGTPTLIMLNTRNEPCAFVGKCSDKKQMVDNIETAFTKE